MQNDAKSTLPSSPDAKPRPFTRPLKLPPRPPGAAAARAKIEADMMRRIVEALEDDGDEANADMGQMQAVETTANAPGGDTLKAAIEIALGAAMAAEVNGGQRLTAEKRRKTTIHATLVWMIGHGAFYRDEETSDASGALYFARKTKELLKIKSDMFRCWLEWESGLSSITNDFEAVFRACISAALRADFSTKLRPSRFWDLKDGRIYISNGAGQVTRITRDGCEVVDNGTDGVLFMTDRTCKPWQLLKEADGVPLWHMKVIGNLSTPGNDLAPLLITLWALALPLNLKNKPPLSLCGEIGSGKTRLARGLFEIMGMGERIITADKSDKGATEFWTSVAYGGISVIDNVDSKCKWLPDAVAGATTGAQKEQRRLYTDEELVFLRSRSAVVITSSNPLYATDAGLADRLINIEFSRPGGDGRKSDDGKLSDEVAANRDGLMTFVAYALSRTLRIEETPPEGLNSRHPDWAEWCWKIGAALGFRDEAEKVLRDAEADKALVAIRSHVFMGAVWLRIFDELGERYGDAWEGDAMELKNLMTKGGGMDCGRFATSGTFVPQGAVTPEQYDERSESMLSVRGIGLFIRSMKTQLKAVFSLSSRTVHGGKNVWRFSQPKKRIGSIVAGPFLKSLRELFPRNPGTDTDLQADATPEEPPAPTDYGENDSQSDDYEPFVPDC